MRLRNFLFSFIAVILMISSCLTIGSVEVNNNTMINFTEVADLPVWKEGNFWKYNMSFVFISRNDRGKTQLKVDAEISDMTALYDEMVTIAGNDRYKLNLDGDLTGLATLGEHFKLAKIRGRFGGYAYIDIDTLGMKEFKFDVDGEVNLGLRWRTLNFDMGMDFRPNFDFFNFPISDNEKSWDVNIDQASLSANVYIDLLRGINQDFSDSTDFDDTMRVDRTETIDLPKSGKFDTYVLSGEKGKSSQLWYAPKAGFLVKVDETLLWKDGEIESEFHLELLDTNYYYDDDVNNPPNKPSNPHPSNHASGISNDIILRWTGGDPDIEDTVKYDVYFGTISNLNSDNLLSEKQSDNNYGPISLNKNTTYYWKVIAFDNGGESTEGEVWEFTTGIDAENTPPTAPAIYGPNKVKVLRKIPYYVTSTDPNGDDIFYILNIYRNSVPVTAYIGVGASGEQVEIQCIFPSEGDYEIRAKATDNISGWSDWSTLPVTSPKNKMSFSLLYWLLNRYFNTRLIDFRVR